MVTGKNAHAEARRDPEGRTPTDNSLDGNGALAGARAQLCSDASAKD
jgi:hypothetical protein